MRLLIVLTALVASAIGGVYEKAQYYQYRGPPAPLSMDGTVADTPEVAQARAQHMAMYQQTVSRLKTARNNYNQYDDGGMMMDPSMAQKRTRQRAPAPLGPDGRVIDTAEVAAAKAAHLAAHARAAAKAVQFYQLKPFNRPPNLIYLTPLRVTYTPVSPVTYRGPPAPLGPDGRVIDTPEVARAREAHMKAHARATALAIAENMYH